MGDYEIIEEDVVRRMKRVRFSDGSTGWISDEELRRWDIKNSFLNENSPKLPSIPVVDIPQANMRGIPGRQNLSEETKVPLANEMQISTDYNPPTTPPPQQSDLWLKPDLTGGQKYTPPVRTTPKIPPQSNFTIATPGSIQTNTAPQGIVQNESQVTNPKTQLDVNEFTQKRPATIKTDPVMAGDPELKSFLADPSNFKTTQNTTTNGQKIASSRSTLSKTGDTHTDTETKKTRRATGLDLSLGSKKTKAVAAKLSDTDSTITETQKGFTPSKDLVKRLEEAYKNQRLAAEEVELAEQTKLTAQRFGLIEQEKTLNLIKTRNRILESKIQDEIKFASGEINDMQKNLADMKVDTKRFWSKKGTGEKIIAAISIALGAYSSAINKSPNFAMEIITQAIDNDIMEQKTAIDKKRGDIELKRGLYGEMMDRLNDSRQAEAATNILMMEQVKIKVQQYSAAAQTHEVKSKSKQLLSNIETHEATQRLELEQAAQDKVTTREDEKNVSELSLADETLETQQKTLGLSEETEEGTQFTDSQTNELINENAFSTERNEETQKIEITDPTKILGLILKDTKKTKENKIPGFIGTISDDTQYKKAIEFKRESREAGRLVQELSELVEKVYPGDTFSDNAKMSEVVANELRLKFKTTFGLGVLSESDWKILKGLVPAPNEVSLPSYKKKVYDRMKLQIAQKYIDYMADHGLTPEGDVRTFKIVK